MSSLNCCDEFDYVDNRLRWHGLDVSDVASKVDTPCVLYSEKQICSNMKQLREFSQETGRHVDIAIALKAAGHAGVIRCAKQAATIIDPCELLCEVMSLEEYEIAIKMGFGPNRIVVNGLGWQEGLVQRIVANPPFATNVDNLSDCRRLSQAAIERGTTVPIGVRLVPRDAAMFAKSDEKMGIPATRSISDIEAIERMPGVEIVGVSYHALHRCTNPSQLLAAATNIAFQVEQAGLSNRLQYIDIGGGLDFGANIINSGFSIFDFAEVLKEALDSLHSSIRLIVEPGRFIFGDAAITLATVMTRKESVSKHWLIVDAGTNLLVPIDTASFSIHAIRDAAGEHMNFDIADGICSPTSIIGEQSELPSSIGEGDLLAIGNSGAYTYALSENWGYAIPALFLLKENGSLEVLRSPNEGRLAFFSHWGL